jgi:muconate cycloisomerase
MRLTRLEVLEARFPFRISFGHALASRTASTSILVRLETDRDVVGYGEGVPREYVTGESPETARARILEHLGPALVGRRLDCFEDTPSLLRDAYALVGRSGPSGAAQCAVELAVLDATGRAFGRSVAELLDPRVRCELVYSGVLPFLPAPLMLLGALLHRLYGVTAIKLKVGRSLREDLRNLKLLRAALGARADLRVDANCAWQPDQAIEAIRLMRRYRIRAVEQPVDKDDFVGLKRVADAVDVPIMADESLRTPDDARRLTAERAVGMFNIRISKCGGLLAAREMAQIAARSGVTCQLGPHPGESAILTAAGRHFGATTPNLRYCEADVLNVLRKQDIADGMIPPGRGGRAPIPTGPGLGVDISETRLERYVVARESVG